MGYQQWNSMEKLEQTSIQERNHSNSDPNANYTFGARPVEHLWSKTSIKGIFQTDVPVLGGGGGRRRYFGIGTDTSTGEFWDWYQYRYQIW
jgi:hypothetical protein